MTKEQIWVAAFLGLFILLFLLQRATKQQEPHAPRMGMNPMPQSNLSSENLSGKDLMARIGCLTCHGTNLAGTNQGPSLIGVKEYWTRDQLINYLRNPSSFMSGKRFKEYKEKYPNVIMPSYNNIDVKELGRIAEYLLQP